jgi:hypothetical protein
LRPRIEGNLAELVYHGLRDSRYVGKPKRRLQHLWLSTAVNLKRMFKLAEIREKSLKSIPPPIYEVRMST